MTNAVSLAMAIRVREAREHHRWSQGDLGDRIARSRQSVSQMEKGRYRFTVDDLAVLSDVLGLPPSWFMGLPSRMTH